MKFLLIPYLAIVSYANFHIAAIDDAAPVWMPLINTSALAAFCAWFMFRGERALKALTVSVERSNQREMLMILSHKLLQNTGIHDMAKKLHDDSQIALSRLEKRDEQTSA